MQTSPQTIRRCGLHADKATAAPAGVYYAQ